MAQKNKKPEDFWREYEEKTGEKVLARGLGQYISGWDEFDRAGETALWGLVITTSGGFRFHHFPQVNWLRALIPGSGDEAPREKTIFIHRDIIISAVLKKETKWYRKLFSPARPRLIIRYHTRAGEEKEMLLYVEHQPDGIAEALR